MMLAASSGEHGWGRGGGGTHSSSQQTGTWGRSEVLASHTAVEQSQGKEAFHSRRSTARMLQAKRSLHHEGNCSMVMH